MLPPPPAQTNRYVTGNNFTFLLCITCFNIQHLLIVMFLVFVIYEQTAIISLKALSTDFFNKDDVCNM